MVKPILLLINLRSKQGLLRFGEAVASFNDLGIQYIIGQVKEPEDFARCIRRYQERVSAVVIGGGDGTLNVAVDALVETGLPLGILPLGTANDLVRTLNLPRTLPAACQVIAQGHRKAIDLGRVNGKYFFNVASCGLSIEITQALSGHLKQRWGVLAYAIAALQTMATARRFTAVIQVDDGAEMTRKSLQIAVGNGRHYGGGLTIVEDAAIDDQRLDLYSLEIPRWWHLFFLLPALRTGRFSDRIGISRWAGKKIKLWTRHPKRVNTDGEITTKTPAVFELIPHALEVFVPIQSIRSTLDGTSNATKPLA
ncbi:lipid kinase [Pantanalinema sp. GBBB05]|uniref:lipid kinase n=1 Tax=Pantanalinema sp. GBBB05 TaxID=2604139 RepID=UPI001DE2CE05|nr:lipid kinase [Pantanalinema sp. GBBB05]